MNFYDNQGAPVAYLSDNNQTIYSWDGAPLAYLHGTNVYSFGGKHLGWFEHGWIIDHNGGNSFFTDQAVGGPMRPLKQLASLKGLKDLRPLKGLRELAPMKPFRSSDWGVNIFN